MAGGRRCALTGVGKKGKGQAERGCGRLAWRLCHGRGRSLPPVRGGTHARVRAALVRRRGQEIETGWKKDERERKIHRSTGQRDKERWRGAGLTRAAVLGKDGPAWFAWQTGLDS
jgi:hypothetical protein